MDLKWLVSCWFLTHLFWYMFVLYYAEVCICDEGYDFMHVSCSAASFTSLSFYLFRWRCTSNKCFSPHVKSVHVYWILSLSSRFQKQTVTQPTLHLLQSFWSSHKMIIEVENRHSRRKKYSPPTMSINNIYLSYHTYHARI